MHTASLRTLTEDEGPFVSVHIDESHDTEDAAKRLRLRLKEVEAELDEQGADRPTTDAVLRAIQESPPPVGSAGRSVIAAHGRVLLDRRLAAPPPAQVARFSALPYLLPVFSHTVEEPDHVVVLVDRTGADITVHHADGSVETETAHGREHPVHKVRGGGPGHRDIQHRAEETARHNLEEVAEQVAKAVERARARLVVLAGEVQARSALHDLLPEPVRRITSAVDEGGRGPGASEAGLDRRIHELLVGRQLAVLDDAAERFRAESGRESGLAVGGLRGVTDALAEANVATVLIGDPPEATVFTGPEPTQIGVEKPRLEAVGVASPSERRADEAIPFAAIAVGADVVVMDERLDLPEGFAALLRHA
ncbi:Rv2629 family ribosome hibernation factor [Amycolatopsis pigmentata]|uniref:Vms1/Ankzf1 family peptidyl-tRNA hydrolase n=1 Tax=Amycolatopsis pigmentata TaxID=450801 RepID=A0ABW5FZW4_9PSEU